jgi:hypothetical protein
LESKLAPKIYRSVLEGSNLVNRLLKTDSFVRPPGKIPFVVDNLWEWARSERFPSRRFSAFASPEIRIAREQGPANGEVYQVELVGKYRLCQIQGYLNAVHHPDCINLPILLFERLGNGWLSSGLDTKLDIGRLWLPALHKDEVERIFEEAPFFKEHRSEIASSIHFWEDVRLIDHQNPVLDDRGEIFFEAIDGYYLRPLHE